MISYFHLFLDTKTGLWEMSNQSTLQYLSFLDVLEQTAETQDKISSLR